MPECYADTLLIETLVPTKIGYNHQTGCFTVEREMKSGKFKDRFALGIIDNDKIRIKYLDDFEVLDKVDGSLILWRHKDGAKHHYIIQISPALEQWILDVCEEEGISVVDFGVNANPRMLQKYTKSRDSVFDGRLVALFKEISSKNHNIRIRKLKSWIAQLKEKNYNVDINELING
jgi:hypothetical protein